MKFVWKILRGVRRVFIADDEDWRRSLLEILLIIAVVLFIRSYVFQFFRVSGPSMCPTLNQLDSRCLGGAGEFIFVDRMSYYFREPKVGEVVVFLPPGGEDHYIKRVLGVPGDIIEIISGRVYHQSPGGPRQLLQEPYLSDINRDTTTSDGRSHFEVPAGKYFLVGDNRRQSLDARKCFRSPGCANEQDSRAFVELGRISGLARIVVWPVGGWRKLENPLDPNVVEN